MKLGVDVNKRDTVKLIDFNLLRQLSESKDIQVKKIAEEELARREISKDNDEQIYFSWQALNEASQSYFHAYLSLSDAQLGFISWLNDEFMHLYDELEFDQNGKAFAKYRGLLHEFTFNPRTKRIRLERIDMMNTTQALDACFQSLQITAHAFNRASVHLRQDFLSHFLDTGQGIVDWLEQVRVQSLPKLDQNKEKSSVMYNKKRLLFSKEDQRLITVCESGNPNKQKK
ncbi:MULTISPECIES: hypothetical protein [Vibrio]|uniref:hypothetical protein n=1 Tax=Vibrio TaxID=662 RepID=UPI001C97009B|nr:hypothetical protein [Vibrio hangzhouensis]MBY6197335.1 hypothetical protein [Vibrio hangzhouensis]